MKAYLDFYGKHNIIPVSQEINEGHIRRRTHLYRQLGCTPPTFRNAKVLEVGPGTGDNAVVTSLFEPKEYQLIDGNAASYSQVIDKINRGLIKNASALEIDVMSADFDQVEDDFDIVICEGASAQTNAKEFYQRILDKANKHNSIAILSCTSAISAGSELLRMLWYHPLSKLSHSDGVEEASQIFGPHLATLKGVSRSTTDWVLDSIFHPTPKGFAFDLTDLLDLAQENDYQFLGSSSPAFFQNFQWYKQFTEESSKNYNACVKNAWINQMVCTLDTRIEENTTCIISEKNNYSPERLATLFNELGNLITTMYASGGHQLDHIKTTLCLENIINEMDQLNLTQTRDSLIDLQQSLKPILNGNIHADTWRFKNLWGRGQQYASIIKCPWL